MTGCWKNHVKDHLWFPPTLGEEKKKEKYNKVLKDKLFQKQFESLQCTLKPGHGYKEGISHLGCHLINSSSKNTVLWCIFPQVLQVFCKH